MLIADTRLHLLLHIFCLLCTVLTLTPATAGPVLSSAAPHPPSEHKAAHATIAGKPVPGTMSWQRIDAQYAYDGNDLGCRMTGDTAVLKLWAPLATQVDVLIFARNDQTRQLGRKALTRADRGVWTCTLSAADLPGVSSLRGCFYQYEVTNPGRPAKRVLDPYARSMAPVTVSPAGDSAGASGDFVGKAAFVDPAVIGKKPAPARIPGFNRREDAIIYEVHVRDFTSDPAVGKDLNARWGSFRAFKDKLPYIKSLGVTHIQLLPVMAWYFGDETQMGTREMHYSARNNQYNWGYDPQNYFSLDGAFSEKPEDPEARIAEFKDLVDAIHAAGMGVTLDVVYTHMAQASFLNDIVPDYYFFKDVQGNFVGDFGNNLASTHAMAEKLLIDSVTYWFEQFGIDGMRWDMMGDATGDSVQKAFHAAAAINPHALFIGEGWRTFKGHLEDPSLLGKGATQDWMAHTDSVGVFSDEMRNELKSGFGCEGQPMFLTGGPRSIATLFRNVKAQPKNTPAKGPGNMVQYIEAHDNLPLYDVIAQSIRKDPDLPENDREIHRRIRLGNLMILTSQGIAFLHAGQEWGRTKQWRAPGQPEHKFHTMTDADGKPFRYPYFIHDSYDSSDAINRFDWAKATDAKRFPENTRTRSFTQGLIALRRSSDAFRFNNRAEVQRRVRLCRVPEVAARDLIMAWKSRATDGTTFFVFVNADSTPRTFTCREDLRAGDILVDATRAGTEPISDPQGVVMTAGGLALDPLTATVIRVKP